MHLPQEWSPACGQCRGTAFTNCSDQYDNDDEVEED